MTASVAKSEAPEYTLDETIVRLDGWRRARRMHPIDVASSAVHHLSLIIDEPWDVYFYSQGGTRRRLQKWLADETPYLPDDLALDALYWLRRVKEKSQ